MSLLNVGFQIYGPWAKSSLQKYPIQPTGLLAGYWKLGGGFRERSLPQNSGPLDPNGHGHHRQQGQLLIAVLPPWKAKQSQLNRNVYAIDCT